MTTESKLAAIENCIRTTMNEFGGINAGILQPRAENADVRWLIAEVRRLTDENESSCEKIKELTVMLENANTAIGTWKGEYERGRQEERREVLAWIRLAYGGYSDWMAQRIERGEHVAEQ